MWHYRFVKYGCPGTFQLSCLIRSSSAMSESESLQKPNKPSMRTSPQRLIGILEQSHFEDRLVLRSSDLREIKGKLDWREAYSAAHRGEIEAVGTSGNPIKYFRVLPDSERPVMHPSEVESDTGRSTAFAKVNIGVFREAMHEVKVLEILGFRYAVSSGEISGYAYTHHAPKVASYRHVQ